MSKKELTSAEITAWKLQFISLFSSGREMVERSLNARFFNKNPQKNFTPEIQLIFWDTLKEFIGENSDCNLNEMLNVNSEIMLGDTDQIASIDTTY